MIRVVVVDDHPVFRRGLCGVLAEDPDITVVGEAADTAGAIETIRQHAPDVALMDLDLPGGGGIHATRELLSTAPDTAVLVLTMAADDQSAHAALAAGARGYLVKGANGERITRAVHAVAAGDTVLGEDVAGGLLATITHPSPARRGHVPALTQREEEILDLVARGWSNTEITRRLVVSEKTTRNHISNILTKLDVPDRARAIVLAREAGLGCDPLPDA